MARARSTLLALLTATTLIACGAAGGDADDGDELVSVSFPLATSVQIKLFPFSLADELGFFEEEGLDVSVEGVEGSGLVLQQVSAGGAAFGYAGAEPTILAYAEQPVFNVVYELWNEGTFQVYVPADSDVHDLADLHGKTIAVDGLTTGQAIFARVVVANAGLDPQTDVDLEPIGASPAGAAEAFRLDRIDAYSGAWESVMIIENAGVDLRCLTCDVIDIAPAAVVANADFAEEHPELVEGMGRALAKAVEFAVVNPEATLDIMRELNPGEFADEALAEQLLRETLVRMQPREGRYGLLSRAAWENQMERMLGPGADPGLAEPVDLDEFLVFDHVDAYNDFDRDDVEAWAASYEHAGR